METENIPTFLTDFFVTKVCTTLYSKGVSPEIIRDSLIAGDGIYEQIWRYVKPELKEIPEWADNPFQQIAFVKEATDPKFDFEDNFEDVEREVA